MALNNYIGQYGESLRRLTALGNQQLQPQGGADFGAPAPAMGNSTPTGMGGLPPPAMPGQYERGALDAQGSIANEAPAGAFGGAPPAPAAPAAGAGAPPSANANPTQKPVGLTDLINGSTKAEKESALKNLEKHVDINDEFSALQEHGIVPADAKMSRHDKGMLVMEFGLRMMSAAAQGANAAGAAGIAGQGLLESYRARKDKEATDEETRQNRKQDRQDKLDEQAANHQDKITEGNQRQTISYQEQAGASNRNNADIKSREKIAELEAKTRMSEAQIRAKNEKMPVHFTDADGNLRLIDQDGKVTTPTEDVTDKATGKTTKKPIKPMVKADQSGQIDPDKVQALIQREKDALAKDPKFTREIRQQKLTADQADAYLEKQARKNVMGRMPVGAGGGADPLSLGLE